jgi:acetylornithine deacetylase/succinyl-diaminopimelate desuccinylase-like protein
MRSSTFAKNQGARSAEEAREHSHSRSAFNGYSAAMDSLRQHVEALASMPRPPGSSGYLRAQRYIEEALSSCGLVPRKVQFARGDSSMGLNLLCAGAQGQPAGDAPLVVVGAHYDSVPESPGADDNASGVAALLELARRFSGSGYFGRLLFAAYDCEEDGLVGSRAHCEELVRSGAQVAAMISLEMVGFTSAEQTVPSGVSVGRTRGDFLALVANERSTKLLAHAEDDPLVEKVVVPDDTTAALMAQLSDHGSFWEAGFPALLATDTAFLRNPHYHRPSDTPQSLDYGFLAHAVDVVERWLRGVLAIAG